jgi:CheY-like chemotaxis protein
MPGVGSRKTKEERRTGHSSRVLVIDDEAVIADTVTEILNLNGYDAEPFYSGEAAIEAARKRCPDLVLADVIMPHRDGVSTVMEIRQWCPFTRVLLFSGQGNISDLLAKARAQGESFPLISKPIRPEQLLERIAKM